MKPLIEQIDLSADAFGVFRHFANEPYGFFLDSGMDPETSGRYSFMGIEPFLLFSARRRDIRVNCQGWKKSFTGDPFVILKEFLGRYTSDFRHEGIPFWGGAVGWFSYDLKDFIERLPDTAVRDTAIGDCELGFYDVVLIFDNLLGRSYIASTGFPETAKRRSLRARARLDTMKNRLARLCSGAPRSFADHSGIETGLVSNFTRDEYIAAVLKAKDYIRKGDIYQVNLSQRFSAETGKEPLHVYDVLRRINPAPFAAYLNYGDVQVASASPERFIKISGRHIETRPIKGTRPRGRDRSEDRLLREKLKRSVKDRAENLMIVDLERNDLGRICEYGSVNVREFMLCEEFPTVFHLTSTVEGRLPEGVGAIDVLRNCFPGGSITGAPKIRSMQIIEELEGIKRNLYTGSIGYIGFNGDMDTSIVIRTLIFHRDKLYFSVGGGIVHDSVPEKEYDETLHKARALIEAIGSDKRVVGNR